MSEQPPIHIDLHLHLIVDPQRFPIFSESAAARDDAPPPASARSERRAGRALLVFGLSVLLGAGGVSLTQTLGKGGGREARLEGAAGAPDAAAGISRAGSVGPQGAAGSQPGLDLIAPPPPGPGQGRPPATAAFGLN